MTGAITSIDGLRRWFFANGLPHWSLRYNLPGEKIIARNETHDDLPAAWDMLADLVTMQVEAGRAMLEVLVYKPGKPTHTLRTNIDIRDSFGHRGAPAPAGVAALPGGIGNIDEYIEQRISLAMLERENEELKAAINAPGNWVERVVDRVAESPHLSAVVQTLVAGLLQRMSGAPMPAMPVNGPYTPTPPAPRPDQGGDEHGGEETEEDRVFWENIQAAADALGVDLPTLAVKLNALVQANPAMAKSLIQ